MAAPKHTAIMIGLGGPDGDGDGDGGEVSQECIDAAIDVAEALGISRDKVDGETLAMALIKFDEVSEKTYGTDKKADEGS